MNKYIIKRSGQEVPFDENKIYNAIAKANKATNGSPMTKSEIKHIVQNVVSNCQSIDSITVEEVQDIVEEEIMAFGYFDVAKNYITYRYKRALIRKSNSTDKQIMSLLERQNEEVKQENSNKNPLINSVQRDYMAGEVSKDITKRFLLPKDIVEAHEQGIIHFHDADYYAQHMHNCCLVNLEDMLQNGTVISETKIDKPHSFATACNIATQIIAQVASSQYGGQSITLAHLAPFVDVSRQKHRNNVKEECEKSGIDLTQEQINEVAEMRVHKEVEAGIQTIQYQVITLMTTNGQAPFVTVFMWINEAPKGQLRKDLALMIQKMLEQRIKGVKNEKGVYITPAFPKLIYCLDENNITPDQPYYYLTELAAKCTAKRMVPDYISAKIMRNLKHGDVYPCMGCVDGREIVRYRAFGKEFNEPIENMWQRAGNHSDIHLQPGGSGFYIETPAFEIYDQKRGFVKNFGIIKNETKDWLQITFKNEYGIICTPDHPFETKDKRIVSAKDLTNHDVIETKIGDTTVKYIQEFQKKGYSYDVTTESEHFTVSGIYSHNCRSFLTPDEKGLNKDGSHKYYGRFNQGVVTINLPDVALSSKKNTEDFWKIFDERLELCYRALMERHNRLLGTPSDVAPILWQHGALARLEKGEKIDDLLFNNYSTISLGYAGLYECVKYMTGKSHTEPGGFEFGIKIMQHLNDACEKWKKQTGIAFSLYGTPMESTTYKFAKCLQKRFGKIKDITDHNYITNSYHVNVREPIDAFSKLTIEAKFQELSPGGAISYVEVPNMENNIDAVLAVMKHIYNNIMYAELNTKSDYCQVCGYTGEIKIIEDENHKLIWKCPNCGNTDQEKMNVARRTCGYIGTQFWNQGRTQEIKDRVLHL